MDTAILDAITAGRSLSSDQLEVLGRAEGKDIDEVRGAREESFANRATFSELAVKRSSKKELGTREVEHVASSERAAGPFKDVLLQSSWRFDDFFRTGAPLMWAHDADIPVLGRVRELRKSTMAGDKVIVSRSEFTPEGLHPFADLIW